MVIQGALLTTSRRHPEAPVMLMTPVERPAPTLAVVGEMENVHWACTSAAPHNKRAARVRVRTAHVIMRAALC